MREVRTAGVPNWRVQLLEPPGVRPDRLLAEDASEDACVLESATGVAFYAPFAGGGRLVFRNRAMSARRDGLRHEAVRHRLVGTDRPVRKARIARKPPATLRCRNVSYGSEALGDSCRCSDAIGRVSAFDPKRTCN